MNIENLTRSQALAFRGYCEDWLPVGQQDLAHFVNVTGGAIGSLNASIDSLVPLWEWAHAQVAEGLECVPAGLELPIINGGVTTSGSEGTLSRAIYLAQCVGAYLYLVCQAVDSTVSLQIFERTYGKVLDHRHFRPCAVTAADEWIDLRGLSSAQIGAALQGDAEDPSDLRRVILTRFTSPPANVVDSAVSLRMAALANSLSPALDRPVLPQFTESESLPVERVEEEPASESARLAMDESELSIVKGSTNSDFDLRLLDPIDEVDLAGFLTSVGETHQPNGGAAEVALASGSIVSLTRADGAVKAIFLECGGASDEDWSALVETASEFAARIGAYIGPNDQWPGADD